MLTFVRRLATRFGIDRAVAYVLLAKLWSVGAGLVTLSLITSRLTLSEQGTYYTFANILGLQIFLELGLGFVVMQVASHEVAHLKLGEDGILSGNIEAKARLSSLLRITVRIYAVISAAFLLLILPAGLAFFGRNAPSSIDWAGPWVLLVIVASIAIFINPLMAFLEGCGHIAAVEWRRLIFAITGNVLCWVLLFSGARLYCTVSLYAAISVGGGVWFFRVHRHWMADLWRSSLPSYVINWKRDVWSFQWRIAVSWISGYFIFQLFTPLLYAHVSAEEAGKMGLTMQISGLFMSIAYGWINTKVPQFGKLVARNERAELDQLFFSLFLKSTVLLLMLLVFAWGVFAAIPLIVSDSPYGGAAGEALAKISYFRARMLPNSGIGALFGCALAQHMISTMAAYMRAHKREPMMLPSLAVGTLVAATGYIIARETQSAQAVAVGWLAIQWVVFLPWTWKIFVSVRMNMSGEKCLK